jgi:hypothetical protein
MSIIQVLYLMALKYNAENLGILVKNGVLYEKERITAEKILEAATLSTNPRSKDIKEIWNIRNDVRDFLRRRINRSSNACNVLS